MLVRLAAASVALVAATTPVHADRKEATLGSIHVELRSGIDLALTVGADGAIASARAMPHIWIAPLGEPCGPHEYAHQLQVPHDYRTTTRPIPEPPFARGWDALCIDGDGGALAIAISPFDPRDPAAQGFVREILESLAVSIRPPAMQAQQPRPPDEGIQRAWAAALADDPSALRGRVAVMGGVGPRGAMFAVDGWVVSGVSLIGEFGGFGSEGDKMTGLRFGLGGGVGISRPRYRAGIHLGVALERPPFSIGNGEDLEGGSLFLDGRAMVKLGKLDLEGSGRAAYHFDVDCPTTQNRDELCGSGGSHDNFEALFSFETQGRLMFPVNPEGKLWGFVGVRHMVTTTKHLGPEQSTFASAGIVFQ